MSPGPSTKRQWPCHSQASLVAQTVKKLSAMQETRIWYLIWEGPLEKGIATHSNILAWRVPWAEEPDGYRPWGLKESDTTERHSLLSLPLEEQFRATVMWELSEETPGSIFYKPVSLIQHLINCWVYRSLKCTFQLSKRKQKLNCSYFQTYFPVLLFSIGSLQS